MLAQVTLLKKMVTMGRWAFAVKFDSSIYYSEYFDMLILPYRQVKDKADPKELGQFLKKVIDDLVEYLED